MQGLQARVGTMLCKFGGDRVMFVVEAICAKVSRRMDRQTDGRWTPHDCISLRNELKTIVFTTGNGGEGECNGAS